MEVFFYALRIYIFKNYFNLFSTNFTNVDMLNDFYDFMRAEDEAKEELIEWFLDKLRNDELDDVPEDAKETILSTNSVERTRIESRLINLALSI